MELTKKAQALWAKKSTTGKLQWLALTNHMADSANVAKLLWKHWLPEGTKQLIADQVEIADIDKVAPSDRGEHQITAAKKLFVFLAAAHDLGKATPVFQAKEAKVFRHQFTSDAEYRQARENARLLDESLRTRSEEAGLPNQNEADFGFAHTTPHNLASEQIFLEYAKEGKRIATVLGAHHGKPADANGLNRSAIEANRENYHLESKGKEPWTSVQSELIDYALYLSGFSEISQIAAPRYTAQVLLSGLIIMVDWLASSEEYFPLIGLQEAILPELILKERAKSAWEAFRGELATWEPREDWKQHCLYAERFNFAPNPVQSLVAELAKESDEPSILVLEAPMGIGKTEAALVAAEIFAQKHGKSGLYFALPTQATANGIFPRMLAWTAALNDEAKHSFVLAHGKAQFNEDYQALQRRNEAIHNVGESFDDDAVLAHAWFTGRKKSMLSDFALGTIDQLLLAALKHKHLMLRHLGLANKVVIIDECHAYDAYMSTYLEMALHWLGAYRVPTIVLSATLPAAKRAAVVEAYVNTGKKTLSFPDEMKQTLAYPLVSLANVHGVVQKTIAEPQASRSVKLQCIEDEQVSGLIEEFTEDGGCVGIIVNTVKRAQRFAVLLGEAFGTDRVKLFHSRFIAPDRAEKENEILSELGKPTPERQRPLQRIWVGTQVLEQSLDIDFDLLITDIAPMDLLLQRMGRLHRHQRLRPKTLETARCLVLNDENAFHDAQIIYSEYLLMRSQSLLKDRIVLPDDIAPLVQRTYSNEALPVADVEKLENARRKHNKDKEDKEYKAETFRIKKPWSRSMLTSWLSTDVPIGSDKEAEAAVRDIDSSLEIIVLQAHGEDDLRFLPWIESGRRLPSHMPPPSALAQRLARCSLSMPPGLASPYVIADTIKALELDNNRRVAAWQKSPWLKGELFLILDKDLRTTVCGHHISYSRECGLSCEKEKNSDA
ncbi:MAG: CRISPR-associated helicase Cas3' [Bradymonadales bacterium]